LAARSAARKSTSFRRRCRRIVYLHSGGPTSDAFANLLIGAPQIFFQGLGDFYRGLRNWGATMFIQDEWRATRTLTINYGLRWEAVNPSSEVRNRLNGYVPGVQSRVMPDAPVGVLFPGDPGVASGIASNYYKALMPRIGIAWDPRGNGRWFDPRRVRNLLRPVLERCERGRDLRGERGAVGAVQSEGGQREFPGSVCGWPRTVPNTFARPTTMLGMAPEARSAVRAGLELSIQREVRKGYVLETRYVGTKGTRLPRNVERNPSVFGPGATSGNADRRRINADCPADAAPAAWRRRPRWCTG
jgi:hypothetical protein